MNARGDYGEIRGITSEPFAVSGFFDDAERVDRALVELNRRGVPSDLVEVVVTHDGAQRHYPQKARPPGTEAFRYAGIGGLAGLIAGSILALILVAMPGFLDAGITAVVQLIGPNLATIGGALLGAIMGLFVHRRAERRHRRLAEAPERILVIVTTRSREDARLLARWLTAAGGHEVRLES